MGRRKSGTLEDRNQWDLAPTPAVVTGGGAPSGVDYLVKTASDDLSAERVVTDTTTVVWDWGTAGQAKATVTPGTTANIAPADATYIVQTLTASLSAERALTDTATVTWDFGTASQAKGNVPTLVGDSGSGGTKGLAPAPAAGDAVALKFLKADATWATPSGTGAATTTNMIAGAGLTGGGTLASDRTFDVGAGTGVTVNANDVQIATAYQAIGKQTIYIPASAMIAATTNGAAAGQIESTTNKVNISVLDFDATTAEMAWFSCAFPKGWNESTVTFQVFWCSTATDTDGIAMSLAGVSFADNETFDTAVGTPVIVTDDAQSQSTELYVTAESAAVTIAGTPAVDEMVHFRLQRVVSDGNDDMAEDMRLVGIKLFYTTDTANDA